MNYKGYQIEATSQKIDGTPWYTVVLPSGEIWCDVYPSTVKAKRAIDNTIIQFLSENQ